MAAHYTGCSNTNHVPAPPLGVLHHLFQRQPQGLQRPSNQPLLLFLLASLQSHPHGQDALQVQGKDGRPPKVAS